MSTWPAGASTTKVPVAGGAAFVGYHIVARLPTQRHEVKVIHEQLAERVDVVLCGELAGAVR